MQTRNRPSVGMGSSLLLTLSGQNVADRGMCQWESKSVPLVVGNRAVGSSGVSRQVRSRGSVWTLYFSDGIPDFGVFCLCDGYGVTSGVNLWNFFVPPAFAGHASA